MSQARGDEQRPPWVCEDHTCNHPTHEPCVFFSKLEISVSIYGIIKITSQKHFFRWARRRESALPCPPHGTSGAKASRVPPGTTLCEARRRARLALCRARFWVTVSFCPVHTAGVPGGGEGDLPSEPRTPAQPGQPPGSRDPRPRLGREGCHQCTHDLGVREGAPRSTGRGRLQGVGFKGKTKHALPGNRGGLPGGGPPLA